MIANSRTVLVIALAAVFVILPELRLSAQPKISVQPNSVQLYEYDVDPYSGQGWRITTTNTGNEPLTFPVENGGTVVTGPDADQFGLERPFDQTRYSLNPGQSRKDTVWFDPTSRGVKTAQVEISSNDPDQPIFVISVVGICGSPILTVTPLFHDFGNVPVYNGLSTSTVELKNAGVEQLTFTSYPLISAPSFSFFGTPDLSPLDPEATRALTMAFDPTTTGSHIAKLTFFTNDKLTSTLEVSLVGTGIIPDLQIQPSTLQFGHKVTGESWPTNLSVYLLNRGQQEVGFVAPGFEISGPDASDFTLISGHDISNIVYSGSVSIGFKPLTPGIKQAQLNIYSNDPDSPVQTINLTGNAVAPRESILQGPYNGFGPGRSTIGTGGDYQSLSEAAMDISRHPLTGGDWEFIILNDLIEANNSYLSQPNTGPHKITIKPAVHTNATVTFTTSTQDFGKSSSLGHLTIGARPGSSTFPTRPLEGTSNITFDGSSGNTTTSRALTFINSPGPGSSVMLQVLGNSNNVIIKNCRFIKYPRGYLGALEQAAMSFSRLLCLSRPAGRSRQPRWSYCVKLRNCTRCRFRSAGNCSRF